MKTMLMTLFAASAVTLAGRADTLWVDCSLGDYTGHDGSTEALAFETIQAAVDAAPAGSTIKVKPGEYKKGVTIYEGWKVSGVVTPARTRVFIAKSLTLEAVDPQAETAIVGEADDTESGNAQGLGPNAVRCLLVPSSVEVKVVGFTIRGGRSDFFDNSGNFNVNCGGGVWMPKVGKTGTAKSFLIGCTLTGNCATRGGALWGGTAIGCRFFGNEVSKQATAMRYSNAYNCIISEEKTASGKCAVDSPNFFVNCTFANCRYPVNVDDSASGNEFDNCVFVRTGSSVSSGIKADLVARNCAIEGDYEILPKDGNTTNWSKTEPLLMSSFTGDWRPRQGGAAVESGDVALAAPSFVPEAYRAVDICGNPRTVGGKVDLGAVQGAAEAKSACMTFRYNPSRGSVSVNGRPVPTWGDDKLASYAYAAEWPDQWRIEVQPTGENVFWGFGMSGGYGGYRYPDAQNGIWLVPPPADAEELYAWYAADGAVVWASPDGDDDDARANGGSEEHPYRTLQAAVDSFGEKVTRPVVFAKKGEYAEGETFGEYATNRLYLTRNVRIVAVDGPNETSIVGRWGTLGTDHCGEDAIRCVAAAKSVTASLQGFTLKDGAGSGTGSYGGGGFMGYQNFDAQLIDCVITNCISPRSPAAWGGWLQRCRIVGNTTVSGGNATIRAGYASACVLTDNASVSSQIGHNETVQNCTLVANGKSVFDTQAKVHDTLVHSCSGANQPVEFAGCLIYNNTSTTKPTGDYIDENPNLVSIAVRDVRLCADSPAVGQAAMANALFARMSVGDFDGNPLLLTNGRPAIGAMQRPVAVVQPSVAGAGAVSPSGRQVVEDGESVTLTAANDERQVLGFDVDGTFHAAEGGARAYTWTANAAPHAAATVVSVVYNTNWYVNAAAEYQDTNDGWTPATARKTLTAGVAHALRGDVVHVAPGVYDDGGAVGSGKLTILSRVVVPPGVTLLGDDRETCIIEGKSDSTDTTNGLGPNAMRCVWMESGSKVANLTIRGGRTNGEDKQNVDNMGGGVRATDWRTCVVEDCTITNCISKRGGAGNFTSFNRCRIVGNGSSSAGSNGAGRSCFYLNCFIDGNYGSQTLGVLEGIVNCYYGADNTTATAGADSAGPGLVRNSVFMSADNHTSTNVKSVSDIVLLTGKTFNNKDGAAATNVKYVDSVDDLLLDDNGCPTSKDSPLVDKGAEADLSSLGITWSTEAQDVVGNPRVLGGTIDLGCGEYDWRSDFAAALGGSGITVTDASRNVKLNAEGKVSLGDGDRIVGSWATGSETRWTHYSATATATDGALTGGFASVEPAFLQTLTAENGSADVDFKLRNVPLTFGFTYAGTGVGTLENFNQRVNGFMLLVR